MSKLLMQPIFNVRATESESAREPENREGQVVTKLPALTDHLTSLDSHNVSIRGVGLFPKSPSYGRGGYCGNVRMPFHIRGVDRRPQFSLHEKTVEDGLRVLRIPVK
jgi:hypothetical protein